MFVTQKLPLSCLWFSFRLGLWSLIYILDLPKSSNECPCDTKCYLSPNSCHLKHCLKSIPFNQAIRVKRICSTVETTKQSDLTKKMLLPVSQHNLIWKMIWGSDCHVTISYRDVKIIVLNFILFKYICTLIYKLNENNEKMVSIRL
jgi:ribosomal protein S26